jgi:fluoride ion exporter CrcB/FEX
MKWIEFVLLAVGAVIGAFLRYKLVESPVAVYGLPVNVLNQSMSWAVSFWGCFRSCLLA